VPGAVVRSLGVLKAGVQASYYKAIRYRCSTASAPAQTVAAPGPTTAKPATSKPGQVFFGSGAATGSRVHRTVFLNKADTSRDDRRL
jgi:hypothetical protein